MNGIMKIPARFSQADEFQSSHNLDKQDAIAEPTFGLFVCMCATVNESVGGVINQK
jgi:hypothetical protein